MNTSRGESNSDSLRKKKSDQVKGRRRRADLVELEPLVVGRVEDALDVGLPLGGERRVGEDEVEARRDVGGPLPHHLLPHDLPARPEPVQAQEPRPPRPLRRPRPLLSAKAPHPSFLPPRLVGGKSGKSVGWPARACGVWLARRGAGEFVAIVAGDWRFARGRGRLFILRGVVGGRGPRARCVVSWREEGWVWGPHVVSSRKALYATDDVGTLTGIWGPRGRWYDGSWYSTWPTRDRRCSVGLQPSDLPSEGGGGRLCTFGSGS